MLPSYFLGIMSCTSHLAKQVDLCNLCVGLSSALSNTSASKFQTVFCKQLSNVQSTTWHTEVRKSHISDSSERS